MRRQSKKKSYQADEDAGDSAATKELVPQNEVVESVPLLRLDAADDGVMRELGRNRPAESDREQQSIPCALSIHLIGNIASSFPLFCLANDILSIVYPVSPGQLSHSLSELRQTSSVHFLIASRSLMWLSL